MLVASVRLVVLVVTLVLAVSSADAAQRRAKREEPPPPPQFKVDGPTRPLAMERMVLAVPENVALAKVKVSGVSSSSTVTLAAADFFSGSPASNYIDVFTREAGSAGYQLAGRQGSSDLFTTGDEKKPELIVGAAITGLTGKGVFYPDGVIFGPPAEMTVTLTIDWQVFNPLEKKLVFRATRQAEVKLTRREVSATLPAETALEAFRHASKSILADPEFVTAVTLPVTPPPQAQSAPSVEIPRVALRTAAFREQIPELRHQVVTILTGDSSGSGFYVADGLIMTNHHVIEGHKRVKIRFFGGREIPGEVVTSDARRDIALVLAPGGGMLGLPIQFDRPQLGAPVFVIGSPLGQEQEGTVTAGVVSAYRTHDNAPYVQADVVTNPGNSGGPMFDDKGNVVAIVVSGLERNGAGTGLNFFIPVDDAFRVLGLGVKGVQFAPPQAAQLASAGGRSIQVSMYPASGPLQKGGKTQPITGNVGGVGGAGTFSFTRPDGVNCYGKWTTLLSKPAAGSLLDKHRDVLGIAANPEGMVGGLALGACSNGGSFQAEYYVVPTVDSGFGAATDSDGNIYKVIF